MIPKFFKKETIFLLAVAMGKPLQIDMATCNKTWPSYTTVKVEVDLLGHFPKRINRIKKKSGVVGIFMEEVVHQPLSRSCRFSESLKSCSVAAIPEYICPYCRYVDGT